MSSVRVRCGIAMFMMVLTFVGAVAQVNLVGYYNPIFDEDIHVRFRGVGPLRIWEERAFQFSVAREAPRPRERPRKYLGASAPRCVEVPKNALALHDHTARADTT